MKPWQFGLYSLIAIVDFLMVLVGVSVFCAIANGFFRSLLKAYYEERFRFMSSVASQVAKDVLSNSTVADQVH